MKIKEHITTRTLYFILMFILSIAYVAWTASMFKEPKEKIIYKFTTEEIDLVTTKQVYDYILFMNIEHPTIVMSQALLESGHLKSGHFNRNNNIFAMNVAKQRPKTSTNKTGVSVYEDWKMSVVDYALWQCSYARKLTREQYFQKLSTYAKDTNYKEKLISIEKNLNKFIK